MLESVNMLKNSISVFEQGTGKLIVMFAVEVKEEQFVFPVYTSSGLISVNSSVFWGLQLRTALSVFAVKQ